jgi:hypothetical protein
MPHTVGEVLNHRYRIQKLLGQGGFGRSTVPGITAQCMRVKTKQHLPATRPSSLSGANILAKLKIITKSYRSFIPVGKIHGYVEGEDLEVKFKCRGLLLKHEC